MRDDGDKRHRDVISSYMLFCYLKMLQEDEERDTHVFYYIALLLFSFLPSFLPMRYSCRDDEMMMSKMMRACLCFFMRVLLICDI
jgi:hypothetical protein